MNTNAKTMIKTTLCIIGMGLGCLAAKAQNTQENPLWAPAGTKVDGKLTEYANTLEANNRTTNIWYTIANDDKNIYFAVKSTDPMNTNKIIGGGISFTINTEGKKKDKDAFVVDFPLVNREAMRGGGNGRRGGFGGQQSGQPVDSAAVQDQRKRTIDAIKEIKLKGFKDIPDSIVSIYNEYSLKGAVSYDANGAFIIEIAIPFSQLGISLDKTKEIAYNLKVNGLNANRDNRRDDRGGNNGGQRNGGGNNNGGEGGNNGGGNGGFGGNAGGGGGGNRGGGGGGGGNRGGGGAGGRGGFGGGMNMQDMMSPTDFWAKYTLAKKAQ